MSDEQVAKLLVETFSSDDDFDHFSDTDLGESDSADEEDDTGPVSQLSQLVILADDNENEAVSHTVNEESSFGSEGSPPRTR